MDAFIHQVLSGLAAGGIYASLALALVMIYQSTSHINFAQGEMAMFSTYLAWYAINAGMPYWWAFLLTVLVSFAAGVVIEPGFQTPRPNRQSPPNRARARELRCKNRSGRRIVTRRPVRGWR